MTSPVLGYGNGVDVEVEDVEVELWAGWLGWRSSPKRGGARHGRRRAQCGALEGRMARLRRPLGAWRLVDDVGANRRGRRRRTADRWPDTRRRTVSVQTESGDSVAMASD